VALLFSYEAQWLLGIQPQGRGFLPLRLAFDWYGALRALGLDVDIVSPDAPLTGYALIVAPSLPVLDEALAERLIASGATVVLGPRSASKTTDFQIPPCLPMGVFGDALPIRITRVESLPAGAIAAVEGGGVERWLEHVESDLAPRLGTDDGLGLWWAKDRLHYLAGWPTPELLHRLLREIAQAAGLAVMDLPDGLRVRQRGDVRFAFNYAPEAVRLSEHLAVPGTFLLGGDTLPPGDVAAWKV
jgi:beta-galactosidase